MSSSIINAMIRNAARGIPINSSEPEPEVIDVDDQPITADVDQGQRGGTAPTNMNQLIRDMLADRVGLG